MNLKSRVFDLLCEKPDKAFTIVEIMIDVYQIKPSKMLQVEDHARIWEVTCALNALIKKGKVEWKIASFPRLLTLYQVKSR